MAKRGKAKPGYVTRQMMLLTGGRRLYKPSVVHRINVGETLNSILGDGQGIPDGTIIEIAGDSGAGKSTTALDVAAAAQQQDVTVLYADFENSFKEKYAHKRGVQTDKPLLFELFPYAPIETVNAKGKVTKIDFPTVESLFDEIEKYCKLNFKLNKNRRFLVIADSIAAMATDAVSTGVLEDINMRTKMDLPMFLSDLCKRWIRLTAGMPISFIFINQLRMKPNVRFGDPHYTPGGNAVPFYAHVRVRVKRVRLLKTNNKRIGVAGVMRLVKSKLGAEEGLEQGYKILWKAGRTKFVSAASLFKKS